MTLNNVQHQQLHYGMCLPLLLCFWFSLLWKQFAGGQVERKFSVGIVLWILIATITLKIHGLVLL